MCTAWRTRIRRLRILRGESGAFTRAVAGEVAAFFRALLAVSLQLSAFSQRRILMQDFHNLVVWQKAHASALSIYRLTKQFPDDERFGLTSQMRRSVVSVPANLAEGCGRGSD